MWVENVGLAGTKGGWWGKGRGGGGGVLFLIFGAVMEAGLKGVGIWRL